MMRRIITILAALATAVLSFILASAPAYACASTGHGCLPSPIIIDVDGSGFHLTSAAHGVRFDFYGNHHPIQMAWIAPGPRTRSWCCPVTGR